MRTHDILDLVELVFHDHPINTRLETRLLSCCLCATSIDRRRHSAWDLWPSIKPACHLLETFIAHLLGLLRIVALNYQFPVLVHHARHP